MDVENAKMTKYDTSLLVEMECPVCIEYMHPPIRQCVTGHSFCNRCYLQLKSCPTCRQALAVNARSYTLEKLHAKLHFPCKFRDDGCSEVAIGNEIVEHEINCKFGGRQSCPLKVINDCEWFGRLEDLVAHCEKDHPNNIFCTSKQKLTCANFLANTANARSSYFVIIFRAFNEYFKCTWEINYSTGYMRWCVFLLGDKKNDGRYNFEIELENQNKPGDKITISGPCQDATENISFSNCQFMITHHDMVKNYCKNGDLIYVVKMLKNVD